MNLYDEEGRFIGRGRLINAEKTKKGRNTAQLLVLKGLGTISVSYINESDPLWAKHAVRDLYFYTGMVDVGVLENQELSEMVQSYHQLDSAEFLEVLEEFTSWGKEKNNEPSL